MKSYLDYITKDLRDVENGIICHGVNCQGVMASGVAKDLRQKWPIIFTKYKLLCNATKGQRVTTCPEPTMPWQLKAPLGTSDIVFVGDGQKSIFVANMFTQEFYGREQGRRYAIPIAIWLALEQVTKYAMLMALPVYMPKVGCGLGGLSWENDVEPIVEQLSERTPVRFFICDKE